MRIRCNNRLWEVYLGDDGTLDTVIEVRPVRGDHPAQEVRFDGEWAANFRTADGAMTQRGLRELGLEAIDAYEDEA